MNYVVILICIICLPIGLLSAQGLTGQLSGTVTDSSSGAVADATVRVTSSETGQQRSTKTDTEGRFTFAELLPGNFTLSMEAAGFKKTEQSVRVSASERVTLPTITLQVGNLDQTVAVTGEVAAVQTESSERSGLITSREMQELPLKGRSYMGTLRLIPKITTLRTANLRAGTIWWASRLTARARVL